MGKQPLGVGLRIYEGGEMNIYLKIKIWSLKRQLIASAKNTAKLCVYYCQKYSNGCIDCTIQKECRNFDYSMTELRAKI